MASPVGDVDWLLDCDILQEMPDWAPPPQPPLRPPAHACDATSARVDVGCYVNSFDSTQEAASRKRARSELCVEPLSKACREKMRRDKLNERFLELGSVLDPGKPPKVDKAAILSDASRVIVQLRAEAQQLKDTNKGLEEKIKELKAEKDEIREEKQRLKLEKESLEQQAKLLTAPSAFLPPPLLPAAFAAQGQSGQKLMMPIVGYPGYPMWQFMPPSEVDTSKDVDSCPPVA